MTALVLLASFTFPLALAAFVMELRTARRLNRLIDYLDAPLVNITPPATSPDAPAEAAVAPELDDEGFAKPPMISRGKAVAYLTPRARRRAWKAQIEAELARPEVEVV